MTAEIVVKTRRPKELELLRDRIQAYTGHRPTKRAVVDRAIVESLVRHLEADYTPRPTGPERRGEPPREHVDDPLYPDVTSPGRPESTGAP